MRISYDADADAAFIYLVDEISEGQSARTELCDVELREGAVILDLDADDRILGIEVLSASRLLPAEVLARAGGPTGDA